MKADLLNNYGDLRYKLLLNIYQVDLIISQN